MTKLLLCGAIVLALSIISYRALGDPMPTDRPVLFNGVGCDTREQAVAILTAQAENGYQAGLDRLAEYQKKMSAEGEPVCGTITGVLTVLDRVASFPRLDFGMGQVMDTFIIRATDGEREFYLLTFNDVVRPQRGSI